MSYSLIWFNNWSHLLNLLFMWKEWIQSYCSPKVYRSIIFPPIQPHQCVSRRPSSFILSNLESGILMVTPNAKTDQRDGLEQRRRIMVGVSWNTWFYLKWYLGYFSVGYVTICVCVWLWLCESSLVCVGYHYVWRILWCHRLRFLCLSILWKKIV